MSNHDLSGNQQPNPPKKASNRAGNVFTIAPGSHFLETLARSLINGTLVEGFAPGTNDPLLLSTATIYLPTRRAARALTGEFLGLMEGDAALLPEIRTLGDSVDDDLDLDVQPELFEPVGIVERQLRLARLVRAWTTSISRETLALYGDENIVVPTSTADAIWFSQSLASLLDQIETEEISPSAILQLETDDQAKWWDLSSEFLRIVLSYWPDMLHDMQRSDPATYRRQLIDQRTARLNKTRANGPIIAAGSTGSIPATARFLKAISLLPQGAVILPGLDCDLTNDVWHSLSEPETAQEEAIIPGHPQYGLARLLNELGVDRADVAELGMRSEALRNRERLISSALLPSRFVEMWRSLEQTDLAGALDHVGLVEASGERQEALAIALAMREVLETPDKTAALVTPDRNLALRVRSELRRYDIDVDDSGGVGLMSTLAGRFVRLLVQLAFLPRNGRPEPVTLSSLIKHPLFACGLAANEAAKLSRRFELALVRGQIDMPKLGEFGPAVEQARLAARDNKYLPRPVRAMSEATWVDLHAWCEKLDIALAPLGKLASEQHRCSLVDAAHSIAQSAIMLTTNDQEKCTLFDVQGGLELSKLLDDMTNQGALELDVSSNELPQCLDALMATVVVRPRGSSHPRLHIYGPLEARLHHADLIILGGLNEGTWPHSGQNDPFLNRPMKRSVDMEPPERRIGLSAHDFQQLMAAPTVLMTRSQRVENAPSVASRWLQRLTTVAGSSLHQSMLARGQTYLTMADQLTSGVGLTGLPTEPITRPNPTPPVSVRPTTMPVTDVETWIRDPYALYAKRILSLRSLPSLGREPDPLLRGNLYHEILFDFNKDREAWLDAHPDLTRKQALACLKRHCETRFQQHNVAGEVAIFWKHRFMKVAELIADWEANRATLVTRVFQEVPASLDVEDTGFELTARADRIEQLSNGSLFVQDYKTGTSPSIKEAKTLSPQLALEAWLAAEGAFEGIAGGPVSDLAFIRLREGNTLTVDSLVTSKSGIPAEQLISDMFDQLKNHILAYQSVKQGYLSRYAPQKAANMTGDYDHLARVAEWSIGDNEDDFEDET